MAGTPARRLTALAVAARVGPQGPSVAPGEGAGAAFPGCRAHGLGRADFVLAIQDQEAAHFRKLTPKPVVIVGHLPGSIEQASEPEGPPSLLMVSSQNPINARGLRAFLENSWPLVRRDVPGTRFRLVGRICDVVGDEWPG